MSMGSRGKRSFSLKRLLLSFRYASAGFLHVVKYEQNMKIHLVVATVVLIASFLLAISKIEFLIVLFLIGLILTLETLNTAIERTVDLVTEEYHPLAKIVKDVSAATVLIFSAVSVIIGLIIFIPYLIELFL